MKNTRRSKSRAGSGFSLIELMIATLLFTIIAGGVFSLLSSSQQRYAMEKDYLSSFQQANVAMDQIVRDVHSAGYPPANAFTSATALANPGKVATPFAWSPAGAVCTVGVCTSPSAFDLVIETDLGTGNGLQWVRYSLQGTTLMRGVANKVAGADPDATTLSALVPYLDNVMNNPTAAQITALQVNYPTMFPGNAAVPVFTYTFDAGTLSQPPNIREVNITLIVQAAHPDPLNQMLRVVTLTGQAMRVNPNQ
jgi:prepilin-type N-terminal cleavage/methylation domain-containing protein